MESLADFLGVRSPLETKSEETRGDAQQLVEDIDDPVEFCQRVLNTREFRQYILSGIVLGDIPPAIMCRVIDHAWGKPVERVEIKDTTDDIDEMDAKECESEAMRLLELARELRTKGSAGDDARSIH